MRDRNKDRDKAYSLIQRPGRRLHAPKDRRLESQTILTAGGLLSVVTTLTLTSGPTTHSTWKVAHIQLLFSDGEHILNELL